MACLAQPVFLVDSGTVLLANAGAAALGIEPGLCVYALMDDGGASYLAFDGDGALSLPLRPGGAGYRALIRRFSAGDLFALSPEPGTVAQPVGGALAGIAQTLRLPLSNLFATASSLFPKLEQLDHPSARRQMAILNRGFYQLLRAVGNLSDVEHLQAGAIQMRFAQTELTDYFRKLAERLAPLSRAAGIDFSCQIPSVSQFGCIDPDWIERGVLNLFSNALKYTQPGGKIRMEVEYSDTRCAVRIIDNGEGMDAATLAGAFSRMARPAGADPRTGLGLVLPIAQAVAAQHGGTVMLDSRPGQGTMAALSFALSQPGGGVLRSPVILPGGFDTVLVELSDALPAELYGTIRGK